MNLPQNAQSTQRVTTAVPVAAGSLPARRQVMNPPAQAEAGNLANTAPLQSDPADQRRGVTGMSSGSEARPVTATARPLSALTPREREVLAMRCDYYTTKEMMRALGVCEKTIKTHLQSARRKIGARSMGELLRRCRLMGL